ncbi:two-component sensor histidine kinase [Alicycliphilus denitrificans]|uniref:histidine kinase n=2 Tax=Alicycliphilus denitrificans TaxID=179636 RepID=F4G883_ALIDK|nr:ATP-binding protein [Alicycliphilus denitrificans]ADU99373.1 ATP-binding region ATPase domain protein [Alicycliphilus denitrificans BC]AEB85542.1 integral membrane sensor signal transduction histidine kinase [Alicycliphilus denitrificans K601]QKD43658.1 two-component sensor histidine kinase [Alicycliphilus denitrificans]
MNGLRRTAPWLLAWLVLAAAGCAWLARQRLQQLHDAFDTDARIAHRVLSQRMVQHEAILATLVLLQPEGPAAGPVPWSALARPYPQVREVLRHDDAAQAWPAGWPQGMDAALAQSRASGHAMLARSDLASGQLYLVQAGSPASFALHLDLHATASADDWPLPSGSPVRAWFTLGSQHYEIQGGAETAGRWHWHWRAEKTLAAASQPLALHMQQTVRADMLPWAAMLGWVAGSAALLAALRQLMRQRVARRRAEQLLQLGQVARLNTLGELAAGMAHELNQPLTAVLASSQAAQRLLADDEPNMPLLRQALAQAVAQARRASDVVTRLRRLVERPDAAARTSAIDLPQAAADALHLLEPQLAAHKVQVHTQFAPGLPAASADAVALQQILHNLLANALQAIEAMPLGEHQIWITIAHQGAQLLLTVRDSGPGIAPDMLPRLFIPFATNRDHGLGLGLTLSQSLAETMGGSLQLHEPAPGPGACFALRLPVHATR